VVEALDHEAAEIEAGGHASDPIVGLENDGPMAGAHQLVRDREAHGASPQHCNSFAHRADVSLAGVRRVHRFTFGPGIL